jgi:D-amino-acid dehydrogenase
VADSSIVIIGSGVAGAATGFALARRGADVTIVDSADPAAATLAGAGIIQPWSSSTDGPFAELYAQGADYYPTLLERLSATGAPEIHYRSTGGLVIDPDADALAAVQRRVRERAARHPLVGDVRMISGDEAAALFPPLDPGAHALWISGAARVDGRALRAGLLHAAAHHGARLISGTAAIAAGAGAPRVLIDGDPIPASMVVVAAGAWTNGLLAPLGRRIGVAPQRGQISHLRLAGADTSGWPSITPTGRHYLVAFDDRVVVGATRETGSGFDARVTAAGQREVLEAALTTAPGLADATLIETRVGLRPLSDDGIPHIGEVPDVDGLFVTAGFGAGGLTMGPVAGELLAAQLLGDRPDDPAIRAALVPRVERIR